MDGWDFYDDKLFNSRKRRNKSNVDFSKKARVYSYIPSKGFKRKREEILDSNKRMKRSVVSKKRLLDEGRRAALSYRDRLRANRVRNGPSPTYFGPDQDPSQVPLPPQTQEEFDSLNTNPYRRRRRIGVEVDLMNDPDYLQMLEDRALMSRLGTLYEYPYRKKSTLKTIYKRNPTYTESQVLEQFNKLKFKN